MSALLLLRDILGQSIGNLTTCWSLSWAATECLPLWNWVALGSVATGTLLLLCSTWKAIVNSIKNRAARREEADRHLGALEKKMKKPERTVGAEFWGELDRRTRRDRRKFQAGDGETMKNPRLAGDAEIRNELDRRNQPDRRKSAPDETTPSSGV